MSGIARKIGTLGGLMMQTWCGCEPKSTEARKGSGLPERPIESADQDRLERDPFVRRLASALIDAKTGKSTDVVIGITGPWGSGKSSILNLLRERLKAHHPEAVVISFDPWLISGRNDLISEFIKELLATIESEPTVAIKLGRVTDNFVKYGEQLAPAVGAFLGAGPVVQASVKLLKTTRAQDMSLSARRSELFRELEKASVPIVVLIDELDRIEDQEIRTVAQLVRSVADFPGISYVLAYDHDRVVQALGGAERGRAYLEKIVQLQIPLPVTFDMEIVRLLSAELIPLQQELHLPEDFQNIERYKDLINLMSKHVIETPRDIKRLVGTFHVLCGMLNQEVDWIDLLAYSTLLIKAPGTAGKIRTNPGQFCDEILDFATAWEGAEERDMPLPDRLHKRIAPEESDEGTKKLIGFLFPSLSDQPRNLDPLESRDALRLRRPLLTTLHLGLLPGGYSKADILSLVTKQPEEGAQSLRIAYDKNDLAPLIDRLNDLYSGLTDINHVQFWKGVAGFVRKPDCVWMTSFSPMYDVIQNFAKILLLAVRRNESFRPIAAKVFINLRNADEDVLTAAWLRMHIFMHGLFGRRRQEAEAFLTSEQTEACARDMSIALRPKHLAGELIPCRWELQPVYTMLETGIWDDPCRKQLDEVVADDRALDGFTLMLFGGNFTTDQATVEKMCNYDTYIKRVSERLASPTINEANQSVRDALRKAKDGGG
jgi:hypothetical protein